jgi:hypothetical protein
MNEIEVLADVAQRFDRIGVGYMLTGSFAMNLYAEPRMTRDLDFVVDLFNVAPSQIESAFHPDYYVAREAIQDAALHESSFNLIHNEFYFC